MLILSVLLFFFWIMTFTWCSQYRDSVNWCNKSRLEVKVKVVVLPKRRYLIIDMRRGPMMGDVAGYWVDTPLSPFVVHARWQYVTGFIHSRRSNNLIRAEPLSCGRECKCNNIKVIYGMLNLYCNNNLTASFLLLMHNKMKHKSDLFHLTWTLKHHTSKLLVECLSERALVLTQQEKVIHSLRFYVEIGKMSKCSYLSLILAVCLRKLVHSWNKRVTLKSLDPRTIKPWLSTFKRMNACKPEYNSSVPRSAALSVPLPHSKRSALLYRSDFHVANRSSVRAGCRNS